MLFTRLNLSAVLPAIPCCCVLAQPRWYAGASLMQRHSPTIAVVGAPPPKAMARYCRYIGACKLWTITSTRPHSTDASSIMDKKLKRSKQTLDEISQLFEDVEHHLSRKRSICVAHCNTSISILRMKVEVTTKLKCSFPLIAAP